MAKRRRSAVGSQVRRHSLRLIQLTPAGTYGAYTDPIMGVSWSRSARRGPTQGLNGQGGFESVQENPTLNDASEFTVTLAPTGSDGRKHADRFYFFKDTPDLADPTGMARTPYFPGDEWIEVYEGQSNLVAVGTPISGTATPSQITLVCRDVMQPLKKTRETASGYWQAHAPRDVFEYYTRLWQTVLSDDFVQLPSGWVLLGCSMSPTGATAIRLAGALANIETPPFTFEAFPAHGGLRAEVKLSAISPSPGAGSVYFVLLGASSGQQYTAFEINLGTGNITAGTHPSMRGDAPPSGQTANGIYDFPMLATSTDPATGRFSPPYTIATEVREGFTYFYLDGQLACVAPSPAFTGEPLVAHVSLSGSAGNWADVDYLVIRKTTKPLNGGQVGEYRLPSPPAPGAVDTEYTDITKYATALGINSFAGAYALGEVVGGPLVGDQVAVGEEANLDGQGHPFPSGVPIGNPFFLRRVGAIYLPLADQDVHFRLTSSTGTLVNAWVRLYVGRSRRGEAVLATFPTDAGATSGASVTSAGLRAALGNVSGWYTVVFEQTNLLGHTDTYGTPFPQPQLTYDVGGSYVAIPSTVLAPLGCWRQQTPDGDSHYDTLLNLTQTNVYQFRTKPQALESGWFPGSITPVIREGRDTDFVLDDDLASNPQDSLDATDVASSLVASASGLGGAATGSLSAEAFDFPGMTKHPFVSQEADMLPTTTVPAQFVDQLLTLLGLRLSAWEDVSATAPATREVREQFPPSVVLPVLQEFDWQPGDGLRIRIKSINVIDATPRQILARQRLLFQNGVGDNQATFRPRPRDFVHVMRRFIRQVYGEKRAFQGQLVVAPATRAMSPGFSEVLLPPNLDNVRDAQLYVVTKDDQTTAFDLEVNGVVVAGGAVTKTGTYDLRPYIERSVNSQVTGSTAGGPAEPRMVVRLLNATTTACNVSYQVHVVTLVPNA